MVQIYLLLVVTNVLAGVILSRSVLKVTGETWDGFFRVWERPLSVVVLGVLTFLTGFFGLLFVLPGDQIFVGDLLPSLSALLSGTVLVLEYFRSTRATKEPETPSPAPEGSEDLLIKNRVVIGLVCLTLGLIHFVTPGVIVL